MRGFLKFLLIFFGILFLSAWLAPILFKFLPFKFEKIFNRLIMISSLAAILAFVRVRKETFAEYGLIWQGNSGRWLLQGFVAGVGTLFAVTLFRLGTDYAHVSWPDKSWLKIIGIFVNALGAGLLIGLLEEFFFRGFFQGLLAKRFQLPILFSILLTNIFYASLHFISKKKVFIGSDPGFSDSLKLMAAPFHSLASWSEIWPAFVGLFIFGCILSSLWIRTRSLYASIGLHAGCVFFVKMDGLFIGIDGPGNLWMGTKLFYDGVAGWLFLILLAVLLRQWIRPGPQVKTAVPQGGLYAAPS